MLKESGMDCSNRRESKCTTRNISYNLLRIVFYSFRVIRILPVSSNYHKYFN